jgi:hypothetical protein
VRDMLLAGVITVDRAYEVPAAENIGGWS